jgi:hypothetical protein
MADGVAISAAVEGIVDEAVARTLILFAGGSPGPVYGKQGKPFLQQRICGYNTAAQHAPWIVLVDLDTDHNCAPLLCVSWLPQLASRLCFRVAVRAVEAWLLADAERIAAFLRISRSKVPADPESLDNPKAAMVALARASRRMDIREDMVPRDGSGRPVGPAYASRLIEFASSSWRPQIAAQGADSLRRAIACLKHLAGTA